MMIVLLKCGISIQMKMSQRIRNSGRSIKKGFMISFIKDESTLMKKRKKFSVSQHMLSILCQSDNIMRIIITNPKNEFIIWKKGLTVCLILIKAIIYPRIINSNLTIMITKGKFANLLF